MLSMFVCVWVLVVFLGCLGVGVGAVFNHMVG